MITLIYGSTATHQMSEAELLDILKVARTNNEKLNITGMLVYHDGNFLQVLEGEEKVVTSLFEKICQDPRHQSVMVFIKYSITERQFGEWEMGFVDVEQIGVDNIRGYSHFLDDPEHSIKLEEASYANAFLSIFQENIR